MSKVYYQRSLDGGLSWKPEVVVSDNASVLGLIQRRDGVLVALVRDNADEYPYVILSADGGDTWGWWKDEKDEEDEEHENYNLGEFVPGKKEMVTIEIGGEDEEPPSHGCMKWGGSICEERSGRLIVGIRPSIYAKKWFVSLDGGSTWEEIED